MSTSPNSYRNDPPPIDIRSLNPRHKPMQGVPIIDPIMIRAVDAARALSMSTKTLYRMIQRGDGPPAIKIGPKPNDRWHFHLPTLRKWALRLSQKAERKQAKAKQED